MNPRVISIENEGEARYLLGKIQADKMGISIMQKKAVFRAVKVEGVTTKAANLLKQTFLAKGGEVAVARGTADLSAEYTDVIILATYKQYSVALSQLKAQPWGLPKLAEAIELAIKNNELFPERHYYFSKKEIHIIPNKTLIMGILNVTPNSFSDGGRYNSLNSAIQRVEQMVKEGADIIDIGAESTRPGSHKVPLSEELERLIPIVEKVSSISPVPISVDTYKPEVAQAALKAGANIINDIWGLQHDPEMAKVAAAYEAPIIIMHNKLEAHYEEDIMSEICGFLQDSIDIGLNAGIRPQNFIIDPGIGFGKSPKDNLVIMSRLEELRSFGYPVLLGTSNKRFIGEVLNLPVEDRTEGTGATAVVGVMKGANIVRVHNVQAIKRMVQMTDAILGGKGYER